MSNCWITVIPPDSAAGRLKKIYEQVQSPNGQIDQVYQAQSLRPESISGHDHLYKSVLHFENPACPLWFLEALAVYTSVLNHCAYAVTHHTANLKHLLEELKREHNTGFGQKDIFEIASTLRWDLVPRDQGH